MPNKYITKNHNLNIRLNDLKPINTSYNQIGESLRNISMLIINYLKESCKIKANKHTTQIGLWDLKSDKKKYLKYI